MSPFAWYPGHVQKAKRQIRENLKKIDAVIVVLDARAPTATVSFELDIFKNKQRLFVLNKSDLADEKYNEFWRTEISKKFPSFLHSKQTKRSELVDFVSRNVPPDSRVCVVGVPNVGKSTIINKIVGRHKVQTGAQPGITRGIQWVRIENFTLMDSPGILYAEIFAKEIAAKLLLVGCLPFEQIPDEVYELAYQIYSNTSGDIATIHEKLDDFGKKRGLLRKGGVVDFERSKQLFFKELSEGRFGRFTYDREPELFWQIIERTSKVKND
uniref:Ribosome biogenesis GTPase A n=1 Tax=Fervidobacterium thailandense TaxID=1008305 RepID=A0A7C4GI82_9BACT